VRRVTEGEISLSLQRPCTTGALIAKSLTMERTFHTYFMASESGVLYLGVTSALAARVGQHKGKAIPGFTQRYNQEAQQRVIPLRDPFASDSRL
jgi:hypothetical protein